MTFILEVIGTVTFAFAGAFVAIDYDLDWLGITLMAVTTACGGGMTRDIILGNTPPMMFRNPVYVAMAVVFAFVTMATLDAVGLAIFTIVGMQTAVNVGFADNMFLVCFVGVLSAVGGGLLRDVMVNRTPVVLAKEIYATASLAGSIVYYMSWGYMDDVVGSTIAMLLIFGIRMWSLKYDKNLPYVKK